MSTTIPSENYLPLEEEAAIAIPYSDVAPYTEPADGKQWFRGNTHIHTQVSDGQATTMEAALLFKNIGWNFIYLTDHNAAQVNLDCWVNTVKRPSAKGFIQRFTDTYPDYAPEQRTEEDGSISYRMDTLGEVANRLNEPDKFMVLPGNEIGANSQNGEDIHCNLLNANIGCRTKGLADVPANLNYALGLRDTMVGRVNAEVIFSVNHPLWKYYDVLPEYVIAHPSIRFFEISNTGASPIFKVVEDEPVITTDQWWDVVNAVRATNGQPLIYGVAGDDIHSYERFYNGTDLHGKLSYIMVNANHLQPAKLVEEMYKGNFYSSKGAEFKSISYNASSKTLSVEVIPQDGYDVTVQFIGTKRGTDCSCQRFVEKNVTDELPEWLKKRPFNRERKIPVYSPKVGEIMQESNALKASYTMKEDDLYIRAKVIMTAKDGKKPTLLAWTQPVANY